MRTFFVSLVGLILAYGAYRWWSGQKPVGSEIAAAPRAMPAKDGEGVILPAARRVLFTSPRAVIQPPRALKLSAACSKLWNDLRSLDLSQADRRLPSPAGCEKLPPNMQPWHDAYAKACAKPKSTECEIAIYDYRAALTEELTKDIPLKEIADSKVLTDKMLARLRAQQMDPARVADVAERLLEAEPNSPQTARAAVSMRIQAAVAASGRPDDPRWKQVDEALDRAKRSGEGDSRALVEAKLISDHFRNSDPERTAQAAEEASRRYPRQGAGPYHQAWVEFDRGNKAKAEEFMQEAVRRDPSYRPAQEALHRGAEHPFAPSLPPFALTPPVN